MSELDIQEYATYGEFARAWDGPETDTRMLCQLLGQPEDEELLIEILEWLAEKNTGYVDGAIPTAFIGQVAEETEKAIRFTESASARSLMKVAHRIHELERNKDDPDRNEWLDRQLRERRREAEKRGGDGEPRERLRERPAVEGKRGGHYSR
jgi:hypothetical protein